MKISNDLTKYGVPLSTGSSIVQPLPPHRFQVLVLGPDVEDLTKELMAEVVSVTRPSFQIIEKAIVWEPITLIAREPVTLFTSYAAGRLADLTQDDKTFTVGIVRLDNFDNAVGTWSLTDCALVSVSHGTFSYKSSHCIEVAFGISFKTATYASA